jgi:hypothetical protein
MKIQMCGIVKSEVTNSEHSHVCSGPAVYHNRMVTFVFVEYESNADQ